MQCCSSIDRRAILLQPTAPEGARSSDDAEIAAEYHITVDLVLFQYTTA